MALVSVIIPTYNRSVKIINILESLNLQDYDDFEVFVVNDGSTDDTAEVLSRVLNKYKFKLQVIHQKNSGRAIVRNNGVKTAQDGIVLFLDDDMRLAPNSIRLHVQHHSQHPGSILVGAQLEEDAKMQTDIQKYKALLSRKWSLGIGKSKTLLNKDNVYITAAHFSVSKNVFTQLGGFDSRLTDAEDFDLAIRAINEGVKIYYDPQIIGWHDDFISCGKFIKRQREYQRAQAKLRQLKAEAFKDINKYSIPAVPWFKRLIYAFFSQKIWVDAIDNSDWIRLFPQKVRYKIYDLTIYSLSVINPKKEI